MMIGKTFRDCEWDLSGTVYAEWHEGPFLCLVMRGPVSLCAYVGVQAGHPLYGKDCTEVPLECHWGLTASGHAKMGYQGWWLFGWDYAHFGDRIFGTNQAPDEHGWTPDEVVAEFPAVLRQLSDGSLV